MKTLHILEFELTSYQGHFFSLIKSLIDANRNNPITQFVIWCPNKKGVKICSKFDLTRAKKIKNLFYPLKPKNSLQRKMAIKHCLKQSGDLFLPSARHRDLLALYKTRHLITNNKRVTVCLHDNPCRNKKWEKIIKSISSDLKHINIIATNNHVKKELEKYNLQNITVIPSPLPYHQQNNIPESIQFKHILYAGGARLNKGFKYIVKFVQFMEKNKLNIKALIQTTTTGKNPRKSLSQELEYLKKQSYPFLINIHCEPSPEMFQQNFQGAITFLLYDPNIYKTNMSGLFIDSIYGGAPVICTDGTLIADQTREYNCGEIVKDPSNPKEILAVINKIKNNYTEYFKNTLKTKKILENKHDPMKTLSFVCNV